MWGMHQCVEVGGKVQTVKVHMYDFVWSMHCIVHV